MTMSLADRSQKTAGIKVLSLVGRDPEAHRGELIKVSKIFYLQYIHKLSELEQKESIN